MKVALLVTAAAVFLMAVFTAWLNGVFRRCPHCRKIGSWRFDSVEPAVEEKDEDGVVVSSSQIRVCRRCGKRIVDRWSDYEGRTLEKATG